MRTVLTPWRAANRLILPALLCAPVFGAPPVDPEFCTPGTLGTAATSAMPESNVRMAERLQRLLNDGFSFESPYRFPETVEKLRQVMAQADGETIQRFRLPFADALLRAGEPMEALQQYRLHEDDLLASREPIPPALHVLLHNNRVLSHLRHGEQENCVHHHSPDSCLLPIQGGGIHQLTEGSRGAVAELLPHLQRYPGDLRARWLLNIAYMTLGEYPDQVPAQWLIPPERFASQDDIGRFPDIAAQVGLDVDDLAGGVVVEDFNDDGLLDVMTSGWGPRSQLRFFLNRGDGTFADHTDAAHLTGQLASLNLMPGDYNNDGRMDVLVLRGAWLNKLGRHPNSLLRNNGDGTFTDVTEAAGLLSEHPTQAAAWFDYDGDGWLDLYIGNESDPENVHPSQLYRNQGNGTFVECAEAAGVAVQGYVKGVVAADYNNDGRPDLYLSRRDGPNLLLRNDGPGGPEGSGHWRFTNVALEAGVTEPFQSFSCWFFDYDNDGWQDLLVFGYAIQDVGDIAADVLGLPHAGERARLYRNRGDGTFVNVAPETGLDHVLHAMGCNFGDLDNDGWLDFYVGTGDPEFSTLIPNRMFRNDQGRRFLDVTTSGGFGQLQKGHGIAFADIDNDGDQDVYSNVGGAVNADNYRNQLFANPGHGNAWLKLRLVGVRANRSAVGARVAVTVRTPDGIRTVHRMVTSGSSFGATTLRQEIGLGNATEILRTEIQWPGSGAKQIVPGLQPNHTYEVTEGLAVAKVLPLKRVPLPDPARITVPSHHPHQHAQYTPPRSSDR